jgi:hypothetical protein
MRTTFVAIVLLSAFSIGKAWAGGACFISKDDAVKDAPQPITQQKYSSFRGISLASRPNEVRWHAQSLGFDTGTSYYVGDKTIAAIDICGNGAAAGHADFDRDGKMLRLSLKSRFFSDTPDFVRKFADDLFEHYAVEAIKVDDDVCFQDVTCFRGVSKYGEQFLILRIGTEAELYVRPANSVD